MAEKEYSFSNRNCLNNRLDQSLQVTTQCRGNGAEHPHSQTACSRDIVLPSAAAPVLERLSLADSPYSVGRRIPGHTSILPLSHLQRSTHLGRCPGPTIYLRILAWILTPQQVITSQLNMICH